jgi:hypothetical protein
MRSGSCLPSPKDQPADGSSKGVYANTMQKTINLGQGKKS